MHDWTLRSVHFEWEDGRVVLKLEAIGDEGGVDVDVIAEGVSNLHIPQLNDWGPSVSVNTTIGPALQTNQKFKLTIEVQSGDLIEIEADKFIFPDYGDGAMARKRKKEIER